MTEAQKPAIRPRTAAELGAGSRPYAASRPVQQGREEGNGSPKLRRPSLLQGPAPSTGGSTTASPDWTSNLCRHDL
jgi:hypothetical protein